MNDLTTGTDYGSTGVSSAGGLPPHYAQERLCDGQPFALCDEQHLRHCVSREGRCVARVDRGQCRRGALPAVQQTSARPRSPDRRVWLRAGDGRAGRHDHSSSSSRRPRTMCPSQRARSSGRPKCAGAFSTISRTTLSRTELAPSRAARTRANFRTSSTWSSSLSVASFLIAVSAAHAAGAFLWP